MKTFTSGQILAIDDLYELQDSFTSSCIPFKYKMTEGELKWLNFVKGRYGIADLITENMDNDGILTFDCPITLSETLAADGIEKKAVMLSDETALQKLFFWLS